MTTALPELVPSTADDGSSGIVVAEGREFTAIADLLSAYPALTDNPAQMAVAVNRIARDTAFDVILDPAAYETAARARIASEDPNAPFVQGVYRLRDFGMPDFAKISAPTLAGGSLVFFAEQALTGLPYKATVSRDGANPVYTPAPLVALPAAEPQNDDLDVKPVPVPEDDEDAPLDPLEGTPELPDIDEDTADLDDDIDPVVPDEDDEDPVPPGPGLSDPDDNDDEIGPA